jgi:hypothetical protein
VLENRVLRRIFGLKRDKVMGVWRKLHNKEIHNYSLPNMIMIIKLRSMRCARHVTRIGKSRNADRIMEGK